MRFSEAVKTCLRKYRDFSGRAARSEYWWFYLFSLLAQALTGWIPVLGQAVGLALLIPSVAVAARRLHDIGRSGYWILLPMGLTVAGVAVGAGLAAMEGAALSTPIAIGGAAGGIAGSAILLYFTIRPGDRGPNRYGPDPKRPEHAGPDYPGATEPDPATYGAGMERFCNRCGEPMAAEASFCTNCGAGTAF